MKEEQQQEECYQCWSHVHERWSMDMQPECLPHAMSSHKGGNPVVDGLLQQSVLQLLIMLAATPHARCCTMCCPKQP